MRQLIVSLLCSLAAVFAVAQTASAADTTKPNQSKEVRFGSLDKDADGKISLNEASEHDGLFVAFKSLDKDKDGMLTRDEFASYRPSRM